jgi:hypothetical protein
MTVMKKICFLIALQIAVTTGFAQKHEPFNLQKYGLVDAAKDTQKYQGYTIRLIPVMHRWQNSGSYGFDIIKENKSQVHQFHNPLPFLPNGVQNKEDAYKIAQWIIKEYLKTGRWQNTMPPLIANELKIVSH